MEELELEEEERRALRGSKFAPLRPASGRSSHLQPRLAHPGGALTTNKAAALAKFLERKLKEPGSLSSIDPQIVERAVLNAKAAGKSRNGVMIRHVASFSDTEEDSMKATNRTSSSLSVASPVIAKNQTNKKKNKKKNKKNKREKSISKKKMKQKKNSWKLGSGIKESFIDKTRLRQEQALLWTMSITMT